MYGRQLTIVTVLATMSTIECKATTGAAGKCRPICMDPIPIDFKALISQGKFDILYSTDINLNMDVDDEEVYVTPITENKFRIDTTRIYGNQTTLRHTLISSYVDNVIYEETVDEDGDLHSFRIMPLAITKENAVLYYRCSDIGHPGVDTRFILIPRGNTLSKEGVQYLLAVEKNCKFKGKLMKLPKMFHGKETAD